jgi:hypothetical protein
MNMFAAIAVVHPAFGFFLSWTGTQKGEEFEYYGFTPNVSLRRISPTCRINIGARSPLIPGPANLGPSAIKPDEGGDENT